MGRKLGRIGAVVVSVGAGTVGVLVPCREPAATDALTVAGSPATAVRSGIDGCTPTGSFHAGGVAFVVTVLPVTVGATAEQPGLL